MALVVTPGAADADSYATLAELTAYLAARTPTSLFAATTDAVKESAMKMATRLIDSVFDWTGTAVDDVQVLTWPRSGMLTRNGFAIATTVIPVQLKNAQCEYAVQLWTKALTADNAAAAAGITSVKAGSVAVTFKDIDETTPEAVDMIIRRMGFELQWAASSVPQAVRNLLVPTWFTRHEVTQPVMFEAM